MSGIYQLQFFATESGQWQVRFFGQLERRVASPPAAPIFDHTWFWLTVRPDRKGQPRAVTARGKMGSVLVEFPDGERIITQRYAVRKGT